MITADNKPTLGIFSLNSCNGCQEQILNADTLLPEVDNQARFVYWPKVMDAEVPEHVDIAVIEGAIKTQEDEAYAKKVREIADKVIAIGMCATGLNWKDEEKAYKPLTSAIVVDYKVRCCPIDTAKFIKVLQTAINGNNTFESTATLCGACKMNEVECLFGSGRLCGGLITQTGCEAICTSLGSVCYGCGGVSMNAQLETAQNVFEQVSPGSKLDDILDVCSTDRLLAQNIEGLDKDASAFVVSRKCGRHSHKNMIEHVKQWEFDNSILVDAGVEWFRSAIVEISDARNYLSDLYFDTLRRAYGYDSFFAFYEDRTELAKEFLQTRVILNNALTELTGRAIHPITLDIARSPELRSEVSKDIETCIDFAVSSVDLANELWENTESPDKTPVLDDVLEKWSDMTEQARFAAAKAGLRAPETDNRRECVAKAVAAVDCLESAIAHLGAF